MPAPSLFHVGEGRIPVLVIDDVTGDVGGVVEIAVALAPFPPARGNSYPGLRRFITPGDALAAAYARRTLGAVAGAINAAFGIAGFDLLDASFSIVTASRDTLALQQRAPHFDATDPDYLAVMHYLSGTAGSGTAFYRQRATGIERVSAATLSTFVAAARADSVGWAQDYIGGSTPAFERIGAVEARPDRVVVYPGGLLHSGLIPPDMAFDGDPRRGRLTANFFVRGRNPVSGIAYRDPGSGPG